MINILDLTWGVWYRVTNQWDAINAANMKHFCHASERRFSLLLRESTRYRFCWMIASHGLEKLWFTGFSLVRKFIFDASFIPSPGRRVIKRGDVDRDTVRTTMIMLYSSLFYSTLGLRLTEFNEACLQAQEQDLLCCMLWWIAYTFKERTTLKCHYGTKEPSPIWISDCKCTFDDNYFTPFNVTVSCWGRAVMKEFHFRYSFAFLLQFVHSTMYNKMGSHEQMIFALRACRYAVHKAHTRFV